jgi:hypothetical protein
MKEQDNKINFLDITIYRKDTKVSYSISRKQTATSTTIHSTSCHPNEHKMAAFNYLFNRINCYPLTHNNKNNEMNIIKQIMYENGYNGKLMKPKKPTMNNIQEKNEQVKWAVFTYNGKQTIFVTKLFKNTNIRIAFKTQNSIGKLLRRNNKKHDEYENAGVYKLTCMDCPQYYIGQTGRTFNIRYKEHIRDIRNNNNNIGYAQHTSILNNTHEYGNIQDAMDILQITQKGRLMDTIKKYYIYKANREGITLNGTHTNNKNPIFEHYAITTK